MGPLAGGSACPLCRVCCRKVWPGPTATGTRASTTPTCLQDRSRESTWLRDRLQTHTWLFPSYRHQTDLRRKCVVRTPGHRQPRSPGAGPRGSPAHPTRPSRPGELPGSQGHGGHAGGPPRSISPGFKFSHLFLLNTWILNIPGDQGLCPSGRGVTAAGELVLTPRSLRDSEGMSGGLLFEERRDGDAGGRGAQPGSPQMGIRCPGRPAGRG